jgi:hypothetical protein
MLKQETQKEIELAPGQFKDEKTGIIFEKVTLNLPVNVVDYYRMLAHFNNTYEQETDMIVSDLIEKLEADFEGRTGPDWKAIFNLYPALEKLASQK